MSVSDSLFAFSFAALLLTITPGLDTALILRTACAEGGKKAFLTTLGIDTGCFIWGGLVALGLGALLAVSEIAYTILKVCGAAYLCWLGVQLLVRPRSSFSHGDGNISSHGNWFFKGMLGNVLNPKMGIFYVSFLPQFIPAGHSPLIWTFILVCIHVAIGTMWSIMLILSTRFASEILKKSNVVRIMDRATGGLFLFFAAKLALSTR